MAKAASSLPARTTALGRCIASKNYGSWSLRGWLLCKLAGLNFVEQPVDSDDPSTRAELLLLSPSFLVPCLTHDGFKVWAGAHADIDHIVLARMPRRPWRRLPVRRPALHGRHHFAPVVTRFLTYYVKLESHCAGYCHAVMAMPQMQEWMDGAKAEPDEVVELDVEF